MGCRALPVLCRYGRLLRPEAEVLAFASYVVKRLNRNPVRSLPGCCLECGDRDNPHDPVLPYGAQPTWPTPGRIACNLSRWPHITTYQRSTLGVNSLRS